MGKFSPIILGVLISLLSLSSCTLWTFQGPIMQAYDFTDNKIYCIHYSHTGNTLKLTEPRVNDRTKGDPLVEDASVLHPLGIHTLEETYTVEELDGSKMVLADTIYRLHFRAQ